MGTVQNVSVVLGTDINVGIDFASTGKRIYSMSLELNTQTTHKSQNVSYTVTPKKLYIQSADNLSESKSWFKNNTISFYNFLLK